MAVTDLDLLPGRPEAAADPPDPGRRRAVRQALLPAVTLLLVLVGVQARVLQWLGGRSLWMDEALLARSVVERDAWQLLTEGLLHNQAAPLAWVQAVRLSVVLFGDGERALRLVPLLCGVAVLGLTWVLARRLLPPLLVPVAVGLVALHPELIYYSNEFKPYAADVAVVLAVVLVALTRRPLLLGLVGVVAVWSAYPSVFVLAGASVLLALRPRTWRGRLRAALQLSPWVASLAAAYALVLAPVRGREVFDIYWDAVFPDSLGEVPGWLAERTTALVAAPLHLAPTWAALLLLALGAVRLLRRDGLGGALTLGAVPFAVLAGAIGAYPLADRLALWLVPLAALLLAACLLGSWPTALAGAVAVGVVAAPALVQSAQLTREVQYVEELEPVLAEIARRRRPSDLVLVDIAAKAAFDHYGPRLGVPRDGVVLFQPPREGEDCGEDFIALRTGAFGEGPRVWLVFSHELVEGHKLGTREDLLSRVGTVTRMVDRVRAPGAEAYLLHPSGTDLPRAPLTPDRCLAVVRSQR